MDRTAVVSVASVVGPLVLAAGPLVLAVDPLALAVDPLALAVDPLALAVDPLVAVDSSGTDPLRTALGWRPRLDCPPALRTTKSRRRRLELRRWREVRRPSATAPVP